MRHPLSKSMMFLALAMLWLPAAAFCWNAAAPSPWQWQSRHLYGPPPDPTPISATSLDTFIDRALQDSLAKAIGPSIPFFNDVVRLHNQVLYGGLGISPSKHVLIGKNEYLHNPIYTNAYCRRDVTASADILRKWAQDIRSIQDIVTARGQIFLYVLTPSKIEHIPETMPVAFPCRSQDRQRFVAVALSYLDAAGVSYVDATVGMDAVEEKYGYDPFPKFGIHWTELAAYPATLEIMQVINEAKGTPAIIPYEIAVRPAEKPVPHDYDYGHLLNVVWTPTPNDTAALSVVTPSPSQCQEPLSILAVGGSFFQAIGANLSRGPCPPVVKHLFYLTFDTYRYESGVLKGTGEADYELLNSANIILLEENIGVLPAHHVSVLLKHIRTDHRPHERAGLVGE
jgi:alginate O-acetyltransferase complex protein AlgJ